MKHKNNKDNKDNTNDSESYEFNLAKNNLIAQIEKCKNEVCNYKLKQQTTKIYSYN